MGRKKERNQERKGMVHVLALASLSFSFRVRSWPSPAVEEEKREKLGGRRRTGTGGPAHVLRILALNCSSRRDGTKGRTEGGKERSWRRGEREHLAVVLVNRADQRRRGGEGKEKRVRGKKRDRHNSFFLFVLRRRWLIRSTEERGKKRGGGEGCVEVGEVAAFFAAISLV